MAKVLLTGIGGSIGCHTFAHIMDTTDWFVVGVDSFQHKGLETRIKEMIDHHPDWADRLLVLTHDLTIPFSKEQRDQIGSIDYIINMASLSDVEASINDPVPFIENNVQLTVNMLEYAREMKPQVFIQISTDEVYGAASKDDAHPEWSPIVPSNPYSASKACQEAIAVSYWRTYGVPVIITNTMNNFGEMQQGSKYPAMLQKWIEKGEIVIVHGEEGDIGTRYYLHARNHSDALIFILRNLPPYLHQYGEVDRPDRYNIVGDKQVDNLELAQIIARLMGKELKYKLEDFHATRPGHDKHYGLNGNRLKSLGWQSPLDFETSLKNTIDWQREHPNWLES